MDLFSWSIIITAGFTVYMLMKRDQAPALGGTIAVSAEAPQVQGQIVQAWTIELIKQYLIEKSNEAGIDPAITLALVQHESSFNPNAYNPERGTISAQRHAELMRYAGIVSQSELDDPEKLGSRGLFQIYALTALRLGFAPRQTLDELFDVPTNTMYGIKLLKELTGRYSDVRDVFAAYNSGKPYAQAPATTRDQYVPAVVRLYNQYEVS
jgi:soluble lytic murein transglycosylase-like protein